MKNLILATTFSLLLVGDCSAALAQGGFSGGFGGGHGGGIASLVPAFLAEALLLPSLSNEQQNKLRTLYYAYRTKSKKQIETMSKLRSSFHHDMMSGMSGEENAKTKSGRGDDGMSSGMAMRKNLFMSMIKDYERFREDVLAVLNEKQVKELRELSKKAGTPDYFTKPHYDIMNAGKGRGAGGDRPD